MARQLTRRGIFNQTFIAYRSRRLQLSGSKNAQKAPAFFFVKERGHIYMPQLSVAVIVPILLISVFCCIVSGPKTPEEDYREREEQAEILTRMREEKASKGKGL